MGARMARGPSQALARLRHTALPWTAGATDSAKGDAQRNAADQRRSARGAIAAGPATPPRTRARRRYAVFGLRRSGRDERPSAPPDPDPGPGPGPDPDPDPSLRYLADAYSDKAIAMVSGPCSDARLSDLSEARHLSLPLLGLSPDALGGYGGGHPNDRSFGLDRPEAPRLRAGGRREVPEDGMGEERDGVPGAYPRGAGLPPGRKPTGATPKDVGCLLLGRAATGHRVHRAFPRSTATALPAVRMETWLQSRELLSEAIQPPACRLWDVLSIGPHLGSGVQASVFLASFRHDPTRYPMAVKVDSPGGRSPEDAEQEIAAIERTNEIVRRGMCPHFAMCYHACPQAVADGKVRLISAIELSDGDLQSLLEGRAGAEDERAIAALIAQVLTGIAAMARAGLVHGDLHTGNVLYDRVDPVRCVYVMDGERVAIDTCGRMAKIADMGRAQATEGGAVPPGVAWFDLRKFVNAVAALASHPSHRLSAGDEGDGEGYHRGDGATGGGDAFRCLASTWSARVARLRQRGGAGGRGRSP